MNRPLFWFALAAAAVGIGFGSLLWQPAAAPPGQTPLTCLSAGNLREFTSTFDAAPVGPRLLLLFSPT